MRHLFTLLTALFLFGCSGSNDSYSDLPQMNGVTSVATTNGFTLTANAIGNHIPIVGYCFSTTNTQPNPNDTCFQSSNILQLPGNSSTPIRKYFVWAKDAFGNVSNNFSAWAPTCSATSLTASAASSFNTVCLVTSLGEMAFEINSAAPITASNFLKYINDGFYTSLVFHRIISNMMVQGGGFTYSNSMSTSNTVDGFTPVAPTYPPIALEAPSLTGLSNTVGTIAMARGTTLNSATSQFFINTVDNSSTLDTSAGGYAVFGKIISGQDTLNAIASVNVSSGNLNSTDTVPSEPTTPPIIYWAAQMK